MSACDFTILTQDTMITHSQRFNSAIKRKILNDTWNHNFAHLAYIVCRSRMDKDMCFSGTDVVPFQLDKLDENPIK